MPVYFFFCLQLISRTPLNFHIRDGLFMVHDGTRAHRRGAAWIVETAKRMNGNGQCLLQSSLHRERCFNHRV